MSDRAHAEEALFSAIAKAVEGDSPEGLKQAAEAFSEVVYGSQGGRWESSVRNINKQETDYRYRSESDIHETSHQGEDRKRPATGFGNCD